MTLISRLRELFQGKNKFPLILITGGPKTGTTALYHSIKKQLPPTAICLFEPENRDLKIPQIISTPVLVKSFIPFSIKYDFFNKKILIVRDPRDCLISSLLYSSYDVVIKNSFETPEKTNELLNGFILLLKKKEKGPASVNFQILAELFDEFITMSYFQKVVNYYNERKDLLVFKYEDYVDGNFKALENYLDLKIEIAENVPEKRVIRSKTYGNWKNWFTKGDINYYRNILSDYMKTFGYEDDWEINRDQQIDPKLSSLYVRKLIGDAGKDVNTHSKKINSSFN